MMRQRPPPSSTSWKQLFGWLLCFFFEWQPPKTDAPSISQFFAGCHWGTPIKGFRHSKPEPVRRVPEIGSWRSAAPRFGPMADGSMEREGEAAEAGVCVCVCVCCSVTLAHQRRFCKYPKWILTRGHLVLKYASTHFDLPTKINRLGQNENYVF